MKYSFLVITKVPDPWKGESGNLAHTVPFIEVEEPKESNDYTPKVEPYYQVEPFKGLMPIAPMFMEPVFFEGEVLIVGPSGREVTGQGRKADKWDVEYEEFDTLEAAIERSVNLLGRVI